MALFRRRARGGGPAVPAVDPSCGDEGLAELLRHAAAGDWAALRAGLTAVTDESELTSLISAVCEVGGIERWIPQVIAAEPDSALPLLLSGARQVTWAWEARTAARAQHVTEDQWKLFHERLQVAEEQLYEVAEREPGWLGPWYFLQISGRGLSLDQAAARYRFEAALRRGPGHPASHQQRLQWLSAKWFGSHEEMHEFARSSMLSAPEGSGLGELVALAHLEHWLDLDHSDGQAYLTSPQVIAQLHEALERSILHPAYQRPRNWKAAYNTFAMALALAGQKQAARPLFEAVGGTVAKFPWQYLSGDPAESFRRLRDSCAR